MSIKLTELAEKVGLSVPDLKSKLKELGFELKPAARTIDEETAAKVEAEFAPKVAPAPVVLDSVMDELTVDTGEKTKIKEYEESVEMELDREIIKSQRKMTAGRDTGVKVKKAAAPVSAPVKKDTGPTKNADGAIIIPDTISVKEFSEKTGLNPVKVIGELMKNGIRANINQTIDYETASIIADDFGIKLTRKRSEAAAEDISTGNIELLVEEKDTANLVTRPPIVTVMGHVDHGKTKLLDAIRETDVVASEAGGITQHIGAYQVVKNNRKITFIDTPGHEAFTSMRARGARLTDIVILVVAADEGVKPQTIEALNHAKDAEVPIIVAINKIDKEDINIDRVKAQLAELGLQPEDWGGKVPMVPLSAMTHEGIPTLLEVILLIADIEDYKANPNRPAVATVLEAHLDKSLGPVATVIVNTGTLRLQDAMVVGDIYGRVKIMKNHLGKAISEAGPATPVRIAGLTATPNAGDIIQVVPNIDLARQKAEQIAIIRREGSASAATTNLERIMSAIQEGKLKTLKLVLKADTLGSIEAIKLTIAQVKKDEVSVKIVHSAVGAVSESDVMMAAAAGGIVVAFNTPTNPHVKEVAHRNGVQLFSYQIIYKMVDELKQILSGLLSPEVTQVVLGRAEVRAVFLTEKKHMIVGCKVISGIMENKAHLRIFREGNEVGAGVLDTLKKNKDNVHQVAEGNDCGIKYHGDVKLQEGDVLEAWKEERKTRIVT